MGLQHIHECRIPFLGGVEFIPENEWLMKTCCWYDPDWSWRPRVEKHWLTVTIGLGNRRREHRLWRSFFNIIIIWGTSKYRRDWFKIPVYVCYEAANLVFKKMVKSWTFLCNIYQLLMDYSITWLDIQPPYWSWFSIILNFAAVNKTTPFHIRNLAKVGHLSWFWGRSPRFLRS